MINKIIIKKYKNLVKLFKIKIVQLSNKDIIIVKNKNKVINNIKEKI